MIDTRAIRMRWEADGSKRGERGQRLFAASEARAAGWGGVAAVAKITGVSRKRIIAGLKDLAAPPLDPGRVRRKGGGRRPIIETDGTIVEDLKHLVEPVTMGDPMRPLMWVSKSQEKLADELVALGHDVSPNTVGRLLVDELAYSRQVNRKTHEGSSHPDRNAQFEHINAQVKAAQAAGQPVISVDTKKKELIGNFRNSGSDYRPKGCPIDVNMHDFKDKEKGKIVPHGIYDPTANAGWVSIGITHDTAEFAVTSIRTWIARIGRQRYPDMRELTITADCGGSNNVRARLWKIELQKLADELQMSTKALPLSSRHVQESRPKELHLRPLAERCVSLSTHTAPIRQTRRQYFDASVRTVCAACWQWTQSFGQPVFSAHYSACTSALPTLSA